MFRSVLLRSTESHRMTTAKIVPSDAENDNADDSDDGSDLSTQRKSINFHLFDSDSQSASTVSGSSFSAASSVSSGYYHFTFYYNDGYDYRNDNDGDGTCLTAEMSSAIEEKVASIVRALERQWARIKERRDRRAQQVEKRLAWAEVQARRQALHEETRRVGVLEQWRRRNASESDRKFHENLHRTLVQHRSKEANHVMEIEY